VEVDMELTLSRNQAVVMVDVLTGILREMSHEIAATDNPHFRSGLLERRRTLQEVERAVRAGLEGTPTASVDTR
jgi:hypothetical protein